MPKIQLDGTYIDRWWLRALMLFPDDKQNREYYLVLKQMEAELAAADGEDRGDIDAKTLRALMDAPSRAEMRRIEAETTKRAICVGDILASIYLMDLFSDQEPRFKRPSMNKAIHIAMQYGLVTSFGDGEVMNRSETKIRKCWAEFRPVAHLWAAFRITQAYPLDNGASTLDAQLGSIEFLQVAAGLYKFGVEFIPVGSRPSEPILSPDTAWCLPESIRPSMRQRGQMPDRLAHYLATYKA